MTMNAYRFQFIIAYAFITLKLLSYTHHTRTTYINRTRIYLCELKELN